MCQNKDYIKSSAAVELVIFFIENTVLYHGAPTIMITDRGKAFTAAVLDYALMISGTIRRIITAKHPQTNRLTERINETI